MFRKPLFVLLLTVASASALVIPGQNGTGAGNTTQATLNTYVSNNLLPVFPYWNNVISVTDSTGIYLGATGPYGWVMTAAHVTQLTPNVQTISVGGTNYLVHENVVPGLQDMRLYRIGGELGDPVLPALPNVTLDSTTPAAGTSLLSLGRGERTEGTLGSAASSDAQLGSDPLYFEWLGTGGSLRWGTNVSANLPAWMGASGSTAPVSNPPYSTVNFFSIFDDPGVGNYLNATEAAIAVGDSGGPAFSVDGGVWKLSGWNLYTWSDPATGQPNSGTTGFGNVAGYGNVATYRNSILSAMVPEPSTIACLGSGLALFGMRRNRKR